MCMSAKVPAAVRLAKKALQEDKCVVIGLQSTGEARTEEAITKYVGRFCCVIRHMKALFKIKYLCHLFVYLFFPIYCDIWFVCWIGAWTWWFYIWASRAAAEICWRKLPFARKTRTSPRFLCGSYYVFEPVNFPIEIVDNIHFFLIFCRRRKCKGAPEEEAFGNTWGFNERESEKNCKVETW